MLPLDQTKLTVAEEHVAAEAARSRSLQRPGISFLGGKTDMGGSINREYPRMDGL